MLLGPRFSVGGTLCSVVRNVNNPSLVSLSRELSAFASGHLEVILTVPPGPTPYRTSY